MPTRDPLTHRILPTCTHAAAEASLYGRGRCPCPQFPDTCLEQNNGYIGLVWRGKELLRIFANDDCVFNVPPDLPLPGIVERLAAALPENAHPHIDDRSGKPFLVISVNGPTGPDTGTAYTVCPGTIANFYPRGCNHPHRLADELVSQGAGGQEGPPVGGRLMRSGRFTRRRPTTAGTFRPRRP